MLVAWYFPHCYLKMFLWTYGIYFKLKYYVLSRIISPNKRFVYESTENLSINGHIHYVIPFILRSCRAKFGKRFNNTCNHKALVRLTMVFFRITFIPMKCGYLWKPLLGSETVTCKDTLNTSSLSLKILSFMLANAKGFSWEHEERNCPKMKTEKLHCF